MSKATDLRNKLITEKVSFKNKAKKGDFIQSFDVTMPVAVDRGSVIGTVSKIEVDKGGENPGVEFVHFKAEFEMRNGVITKKINREVRVPQNGTPSTSGSKTDGINVIK